LHRCNVDVLQSAVITLKCTIGRYIPWSLLLVNLEFTRHWVYTVKFLITEVKTVSTKYRQCNGQTGREQVQHYINAIQNEEMGLGCLTPLILWLSVLLVEEIGVPVENHRPVVSHRKTVSHNVVSSTPPLSMIRAHNVSDDRH